jgi:hypothetical protein
MIVTMCGGGDAAVAGRGRLSAARVTINASNTATMAILMSCLLKSGVGPSHIPTRGRRPTPVTYVMIGAGVLS